MRSTPPIIGWGRPLGKETFCGVVAVEAGGSVLSACRGRWSAADRWERIHGRDAAPMTLKLCGCCASIARQQRHAEGVRELAISMTYARHDTMQAPSDDADTVVVHERFDVGGDT